MNIGQGIKTIYTQHTSDAGVKFKLGEPFNTENLSSQITALRIILLGD